MILASKSTRQGPTILCLDPLDQPGPLVSMRLCVRDTGRTRMPSNQGAQTSHNVGQLKQNRDFDFATTPQPALHHTSAPCVLDTTNQL